MRSSWKATALGDFGVSRVNGGKKMLDVDIYGSQPRLGDSSISRMHLCYGSRVSDLLSCLCCIPALTSIPHCPAALLLERRY